MSPPLRVGLDVFDCSTGELVGTIVVDGRPNLSGAACRRCGRAAYDIGPLLAARGLAAHLRAEHGVQGLGVALGPLRRERRLGPARFGLAVAVDRAVSSEEAAA